MCGGRELSRPTVSALGALAIGCGWWSWRLARAANDSFAEADASLPPLVAFLETAAPFLLKAYGRPAGELLQLLGGVAAASKGGAAANLASANISDLVDRAARGQLTVPETFTTFTAPA